MGREMTCQFQCRKNSAGSFDQSNSAGAINLKMGGSALKEKSSFKMLALTFSSKLG